MNRNYEKMWKKLKKIVRELKDITEKELDKKEDLYLFGCRDVLIGILLKMRGMEEEMKEKERGEE